MPTDSRRREHGSLLTSRLSPRENRSMSEPSERESIENASRDQPQARRRRRWFQFGLRTLLVIMVLAACAVMAWRVYVEPYRRQGETAALIEKLGGSYKTAQADKWLCKLFGEDFQDVVLVDLADCDGPAEYLEAIGALPRL